MKKIFVLAIASILMSGLHAQIPNENEAIEALQSRLTQVERDLKTTRSSNADLATKVQVLESQLSTTTANVGSLQEQVNQTGENLKATEGKLNGDIKSTNALLSDNARQTNESIKNRTNYGIMALVAVILVILLVAFLLRRRMSSGLTAIDGIKEAQDKLQSAQKTLAEESAKLDMKMIELFEKMPTSTPNGEVDHSLNLKVINEIMRIEMNLSRMDTATRGYSQLSRAVNRIKNNFAAKGYVITDLMGKAYNDGMLMNAEFVIDDKMEFGKSIITFISTPEVLFNGSLIQQATVTVSQNI